MKSSSAAPIVTFPPIDTITTVDGSIPISLEERAIDVWGCSLSGSDVALEQCRAWLSEEERTRAARFIRHEDQLMYVLAHGGLRALLSRYAGLDPAAITFQAADRETVARGWRKAFSSSSIQFVPFTWSDARCSRQVRRGGSRSRAGP